MAGKSIGMGSPASWVTCVRDRSAPSSSGLSLAERTVTSKWNWKWNWGLHFAVGTDAVLLRGSPQPLPKGRILGNLTSAVGEGVAIMFGAMLALPGARPRQGEISRVRPGRIIRPMRVLVVAANTERGNMITMPLGAGLVAAAGRHGGHDVRFLDLLNCANPIASVTEAIEAFVPEAIGISVRNIDDQNREQPRFLLAQVKPVVDACRASSAAPIILGGPGFSIFPDETLRYLGADFGIAGEGEIAFVELLRRLNAGMDPTDIPGLYSSTASSPAQHRGDLDTFPFWDDVLTASARLAGEDIWIPVQTRRGCPNDCSYCSTSAIQGRVIRMRSPEAAVAEIRSLTRAGFHHLFFVDNSFNIPEQYAMSLCRLLEAASLDMEWRCILYPHRVSEELVVAMARAGCVEVSLGFESGSPGVLREMNKRYTPDDVRRACELLEKHGVRRVGFLLFGGPGETRDTVEESLAFAESLHLDTIRITVGIRIYPHTALARHASEEGVIRTTDNLLTPTFYLAPGLEPWIHERVRAVESRRAMPQSVAVAVAESKR